MIYINGRFLEQKLTGVQRFAKEISIHLSSIREDVIVLVSNLNNIDDNTIFERLKVEELRGGSGHFWEQITLPKFLISKGKPLLINLTSTAPVFYKNKISTHHDITYIRYPQSFSLSFRMLYKILIPKILLSSKAVITVSEFSKNEICEYYKLNENKVDVIYNAVSTVFLNSTSEKMTSRPYLLAVSSPNYHKNFEGLIEAFSGLEIDIDLKIIGSLSSSFNKIEYDIKNDPRVMFMGRVNDSELANLYKNAFCFVFPSFYEGFGIPPLEAQAQGCPVISSNAASMPEVLGNSVIYFNPNDIEDIRQKLLDIFVNKEGRKRLIELGYKNIERYSWANSAEKLNDIINEI
ncbi:glycosyltransferase family 4 protein [Klebsiella quasipneumoniae]|uniref:glycosyltransferase family 4 protein n=1 Tax=Klebsiella quasipneumoniae TaxID=1463165 RepID=UPI00202CD660|nr:glycosyltransferase family 1 protein [Klebsiella quasipneumoniae]MDN2622303.1 glycosyltransferase family 4 protein [Klebsiella quasipneumoniae]URR19600.1 glycosyltransferase family 4 protein [Klebsiella quasipneumoniae]WOK61424.1 glycosyltransferase family 1 protein [Klebsiella quasipneumoniae]